MSDRWRATTLAVLFVPALAWLVGARTVGAQSDAPVAWPGEPAGWGQIHDQPWDALTGNGWNWLRRASSLDPSIVADTTAPLSPQNVLQMVFTPDMGYGNEPSVHWIGLPWVEEIYTGWWIKLSPNWTCSLNEWCTHVTYLFAQDHVGQVYTAYYHPSEDLPGPPYRIGANTEWAPYFTHPWYPNVTTTWVYPGEWHRIEFYYKWETTPGVSGDGIIRWWVDGVLNGDYTNVHYPSERGFQEFQLAPTFGTPPAEQYMFVDHTRVATPGGTATSAGSFTVSGGGGTVRIEETTTAVAYTGTWTQNYTGAPGGWSGGSVAFSAEAGARATLSFSGTGVSWIGYRASNTGIANVYVDGTLVATIDTFASADEVGAVLYTNSGLASGPHTLTVEATGGKNAASTDSIVVVDAFDVTS